MKLIDSYIIKKFLGTFIYALSFIIIIVIVFDLSEKVEDFIKHNAPWKAIVFDYYLNFIPYFANLFSPLFTFIAVIFFTSRMAYRTEIVAILGGGVSFKRMLYPYMLAATIITSGSLILNNFIIPRSNRTRIAFEDKYVHDKYINTDQNIHRQISPGSFIYFGRFDVVEKVGYNFSLERIEGQKVPYKLIAETAKWDSLRGVWQISNYSIRKIVNDTIEIISKGEHKDTVLNFYPKDLGRKIHKIEAMGYSELSQFIADEQMKGSGDIEKYKLVKYKRIALPFATYILTLIGVALSSRKVRGGLGWHLGLGILISFTFIMLMQVSDVFAAGGLIPPVIAVWIPHIIYLVLAIVLLRRAPK